MPIYKIAVPLQRENQLFMGGLSFNKEGFNDLQINAHHFLHAKEFNRLASLQNPKRQHSYLLGRYSAKQAISTIDNTDLNAIFVDNGVFQQPIVHHPNHMNIQVSISHTETLGAAIAFPEAHPMGIDIENVCDNQSEILKKQFTISEQQLLSNNSMTELRWLWTAKEALSKVLRCGFMMPFELLEIVMIQQQRNSILGYFKNFHQYQALSFQPTVNTICSIVYPKKTQLSLDITAIQKALN